MKVTLKVSQAWPDVPDVYDVGYNRICIGRVWLDRSATELPWEWLISLPMRLPDTSTGRAASRRDALNAFAAEWAKLLGEIPKSRIERVLAFARDLESQPVRKAPVSQPQIDKTGPLVSIGPVAPPALPTSNAAPSTFPAPLMVGAGLAHHEAPVRDLGVSAGPGALVPREPAEAELQSPVSPPVVSTGLPDADQATQFARIMVSAVNHPLTSQKLPRDLQNAGSGHEAVVPSSMEQKQSGSNILRDLAAILSRHA